MIYELLVGQNDISSSVTVASTQDAVVSEKLIGQAMNAGVQALRKTAESRYGSSQNGKYANVAKGFSWGQIRVYSRALKPRRTISSLTLEPLPRSAHRNDGGDSCSILKLTLEVKS